jgi:hypothetical protein
MTTICLSEQRCLREVDTLDLCDKKLILCANLDIFCAHLYGVRLGVGDRNIILSRALLAFSLLKIFVRFDDALLNI